MARINGITRLHTWHSYMPWSRRWTNLICNVHVFEPGVCNMAKRSSFVYIWAPDDSMCQSLRLIQDIWFCKKANNKLIQFERLSNINQLEYSFRNVHARKAFNSGNRKNLQFKKYKRMILMVAFFPACNEFRRFVKLLFLSFIHRVSNSNAWKLFHFTSQFLNIIYHLLIVCRQDSHGGKEGGRITIIHLLHSETDADNAKVITRWIYVVRVERSKNKNTTN